MAHMAHMVCVICMSCSRLWEPGKAWIIVIDMPIHYSINYIGCCWTSRPEVGMLWIWSGKITMSCIRMTSNCHGIVRTIMTRMSLIVVSWNGSKRGKTHCYYSHLENIFLRDFTCLIREKSWEFFLKFGDDFFLRDHIVYLY